MSTAATQRKVDWDSVEESRTAVKPQLVKATIVGHKYENFSSGKGKSTTQFFMPYVDFKIEKGSRDGTKIKGIPLRANFTLGTEDDPKFLDPATRGPGLGQLKKLIKKSGAKLVSDIEKQLKLLTDKTVLIDLDQRLDGTKVYADLKDFYAVGERSLDKPEEDEGETEEEEKEEEEEEDED